MSCHRSQGMSGNARQSMCCHSRQCPDGVKLVTGHCGDGVECLEGSAVVERVEREEVVVGENSSSQEVSRSSRDQGDQGRQQSQGLGQTDSKTDRQTDRQTEVTYFEGPHPEV